MLLESGYLKRESPINTKLKRYLNILVHAYVENDEVISVSFESKLCYLIEENLQVGNVSYSLIQADKVYAVVEKGAYSPKFVLKTFQN